MNKILKILLIFALLLAAVFAARSGWDYFLERFFPLKYEGYIEKYAEEYGLSEYLVMGVINSESSFDHEAHSGKARGLMQLTDDTAKWICEKLRLEYSGDISENPEFNIKMGCYYLSYLINKYENVPVALAAYNAGLGNVNSWLADTRYSADGATLSAIPYGETDRYVKRVQFMERIYEKLY